jgi:hypothetical protein
MEMLLDKVNQNVHKEIKKFEDTKTNKWKNRNPK